jgi:hypothetical protein
LVSPHARKNAIEFEKLLVVSLFDNLTILEDKNQIRIGNGRKPMGNRQR